MPDLTPRVGIKKPLGNENVSRASFNENWDIIDTKVATLGSDGKVPGAQLPLADSISDTSTTKAATANSVKLAVDWAKGYGLGTSGKTITDFNTAVLAGFYYIQPGPINGPTGNTGSLIVGGGNSFLSQMFIDFNTGALHVRRRYSDMWQPWKEIATKEYVDAAPVWTNLELTGGAVEYSSTTIPKFTKQGNIVSIKGAIKNITSFPVTVGTLPAGFRPVDSNHAFAQTSSNEGSNIATTARWQISTSGVITLEGKSGTAPNVATWFPMNTTFIVG